MAVVKVIEILAQSDKSWEDAAKVALAEAAKSVRGIKSIYIKDMQAIVDNDKIVEYRVNAKISFTVGEH
jgi:dodecin